ncbi:unnamed protein product [Fraxinus pennsylvanica]|uniref:Uncharacterized protein n=1 Tax=Fraxinus pennsylvanica TaxID=56036 RepID=A0AAD1ZHL4_9LAMI|nr:unnamed protein product [Fraxinus pennsylvanica]
MAPIFDLVRDINVTKTSWALEVRVIRVYELLKFTNPKTYSLEFISHDSKIYIFKHFNDILNATNVNNSELFDVIGEVVGRDVPKTKEVSERMAKLIDIEIEDLEKNQLPCTLWGDFVDEVDAKLAENNGEPVILLLQMCRAKGLNGVYRVCNTFHVTKMIINGSCDEVTDFRSKLLDGMETSSQRVSLLSSSTVYTVSGDLEMGNAEIRTIDQLTSAGEVK